MPAKRRKKYYYWGAFLLQPFLTTWWALKNFRVPGTANIVWAFTAFLGFTYAIGIESQGSDIVRHVAGVERLYGVPMDIGSSIDYFRQSGEVDVLNTFLRILISRITDSQLVLTGILGIIFGFFYSRNMWYILNRVEGRLSIIAGILITCLFLVTPIWEINGFRFHTAVHAFLFGLLPFLFEGKRKSLWMCFATPFIFHYAFIGPAFVLGVYLLAGNRLNIYYGFFILSILFSEFNIQAFNQLLEQYLPEAMLERSASYRAEERVEEFRTGGEDPRNWYAIWYRRALHWPIMAFLIVIFWKGRGFMRANKYWLRLFSFSLLFFGFANFLSTIPSGHRYLAPASLLALGLIILYIQNYPQEKLMRQLIKVSYPALILFIIVAIRTSLYNFSLTTLFGNPFIALITTDYIISLNDILKYIF